MSFKNNETGCRRMIHGSGCEKMIRSSIYDCVVYVKGESGWPNETIAVWTPDGKIDFMKDLDEYDKDRLSWRLKCNAPSVYETGESISYF